MGSRGLVIDTTVFIEFLRAKDKTATTLFRLSEKSTLYISSVTFYELLLGATTEQKQDDVKLLTEDLLVLPFDEHVAKKASEIYHQLRLQNKMIEFRDIFIAATCLVHQLPIKTLNKKDFERIKGLVIDSK